MKVKELIAELGKHDPEAEVHYPADGPFSDTTEIHELYASETTYGLLLPEPTTVPIVVLASGSEGL